MNKNILALVAGLTLMPWPMATLRADFFGDLAPNLIQAKDGKAEPFKVAEKPKFTAKFRERLKSLALELKERQRAVANRS